MNKINDIDTPHWSIDALNKAYRQGYMFGLSGENKAHCPYRSDVIAAAWEAGWNDGQEQAWFLSRQASSGIAASA